MILIVDGYNVIHKNPELRSRMAAGLESAREGLARLVAAWRAKHPSYECVIVFDGKTPHPGEKRRGTLAGVECRYTATGKEADDEILAILRQGPGRGAVVVSDDNYVRNNCRALGVEVKSASFLEVRSETRSAGSAPKKSPPSSDKNLGRKAVSEINDEIRRALGL